MSATTECSFILRLPGGFELGASGTREHVVEVYSEFSDAIIQACVANGGTVSDVVAGLIKEQPSLPSKRRTHKD